MASSFTDLLNTGSSFLATIGLNSGNAATGNTGINPYSLLAGAYDTIEVRSNAAPPVKIAVADLGGGPSAVSQALQPTIIFSGPAGQYTLAPYGAAGEYTGWLTSVGSALALAGVGFLAGRYLLRKK